MRESFFEGYEHERIPPAGHFRCLGTLDVTGRVATVNRQISLLTAGREGTRGVRFLRNSDVDPEKPPVSRRQAQAASW